MSGIRVTYTGLIAFVLGLATMFSSMIFTVIITRTLTPIEYGSWGIINSILVYAVAAEPLIGYWIAREIARKKESGRTGVWTSGFLSIGGIGFYIIIAYIVGIKSDVDLNIIFLAAILVPFRYLNGTLAAINLSWKPHTMSYALIAQSLTQIPLTLFFVYFMDWGIAGLIISILLAHVVSNIMLGIYVREKIMGVFRIDFAKKWFRLSWISLYPSFIGVIFRLDVIIFTLITGSVIGVAFWSASYAISIIISHSSLISRAMYTKLLEGEGDNYIQRNFTQFFYFSIPLLILTIVFAKPALFVLNPNYEDAEFILSFLSVTVFFTTVGAVIEMIILGNENVDSFENSKFKDFIKSKLFFMPTIELIQQGTYIIALIVGLIVLMPIFSEIELLTYWAILGMVLRIPFTIYKYKLLKKSIKFELETRSIAKYLFSGIVVFGIIFMVYNQFLEYNERIFVFLPNLLVYVGLGVGGYLAMTYMIDSKTRRLFNAILQEVKGKK